MRVPKRIPLRIGDPVDHGFHHLFPTLGTQPQASLIRQRCLAARPILIFPKRTLQTQTRNFTKTTPPRSASATAGSPAGTAPADSSARAENSYFLSNSILARIAGISKDPFDVPATTPSNPAALSELPPHRRRQAARRLAKANAAAQANGTAADAQVSTTATLPHHIPPADHLPNSDLPANASTILTDAAARQTSVKRLASTLLSLAKPRLTVLVVLSAMVSYAMYPVPSFLSPGLLETAPTPSLSPLTLSFLTIGTALCSASANSLNMLYEPDTDALMSRTRNRPLVRMLLSTRVALAFAVACGVAGTLALHYGVNSTTAFLGAANIALYAGVYTPMKRLSVLNTWVGALVGGIPPLMGWTAAAGESATGLRDANGQIREPEFRELLFAPDGSSVGGWLFAALLVSWQFPHFMAVSFSVRNEYRKAGLRMLSWVNPARNGRVAVRYSLAFIPICVGLCAVGVTEWSFAVTSLPVNLWLARDAFRFWKLEGAQGSARGLFWASVWHLPVVMVLALLQKKGMWARVWRSITGTPNLLDEDEDFDDDDDEYEWEAANTNTDGKSPLPQQAGGLKR